MEGEHQTKVAVLGGGIAGLTAAFELTRTQELRDRYDVTVYEQDHRLGGKGASGRNAKEHQRIEEHGLHMWFGFYRNAFRMMNEVYAVTARRPPKLETVDEAFTGCSELILWDRYPWPNPNGVWKPLRVSMPEWEKLRPWDPKRGLPSFWEVVNRAAELIIGALEKPELVDVNGEPLERPGKVIAILKKVARRAATLVGFSPSRDSWALGLILKWLEEALQELVEVWGEDRIREDPQLRLYYSGLDLFKTLIKGVIDDRLLRRGLDSINDEDLIEWFRRHQASDITLGGSFYDCTPILRAVYDVAFLFPGGNIHQASAAAGTAINDLLRLVFTYRGALYYKMTAGMGDAIFAPVYEALKARGVKFRFQTEVEALHLDADGVRVESIDVVSHATDDEWHERVWPLVEVGDGIWSWPSEPQEGRRLRQPLRRPSLEYEKDFHEVVLAIPVGALRREKEGGTGVVDELLAARLSFEAMVRNSATVATQAFQVWTRESSAGLGGPNHDHNVSATFEEPLDTYCDMSHVLHREQWASGDVKCLAYVCGVLDDRPGEDRAQAEARVETNMNKVLATFPGTLWGTTPHIVSKYSRANFDPWERYVITPEGSVRFRLRAGESGFENVVLAGDWTRNGIDGGCVEAAVMSGMQAAEAITRPPALADPEDAGDRWLDPPWLRTASLPDYIEYGLTTSRGGPFSCTNVKMRCFLLQGDEELITAFVNRTLNAAGGDKVTYEPMIGPYVALMMGINRVKSPEVEGYVDETLASFWIPLTATRAGSPNPLPYPRWFISHIVVDNPISLYAGREIYGFAKAMGQFNPTDGFTTPKPPADVELSVDVFGGDFKPSEVASWRRLLTVKPATKSASAQATPDLEEVKGLAGLLYDLAMHGTITQVFVKQFRDASDQRKACYQRVVEAPSRITKLRAVRLRNPLTDPWEVEVKPMRSHPITAEIGVGTQTTRLTYEVMFDFDVLPGVEVAP